MKFSVKDNHLLKYEETRKNQIDLQNKEFKGKSFTDYLLELDFENIKTMWISKRPVTKMSHRNSKSISPRGGASAHIDLIIQLHKPCNALKFGPSKDFSEVMLKPKRK